MPRTPTKPKKRAVNAQPELPAAVAKVLAGQKVTTDSGALLSSLIERWGGTDRLAADIHGEFQGGTKGGMTRQRILEMMTRLILTNTTHDIGKARVPSDMGDEELESVALKYLGRMSGDATAAPAATASEEG